MIPFIQLFVGWTFVIYWCHRAMHDVPFLWDLHQDHHAQITNNTFEGFTWKNIFLYFDSWTSTVEQWIGEILPTLAYCWLFDCWWLAALYYVWAAFIQESIEHNPKVDLYPFLTSGRWHLIHHRFPSKNYGVFFPIWDMIFGTERAK